MFSFKVEPIRSRLPRIQTESLLGMQLLLRTDSSFGLGSISYSPVKSLNSCLAFFQASVPPFLQSQSLSII